jgi:hypothetical protein
MSLINPLRRRHATLIHQRNRFELQRMRAMEVVSSRSVPIPTSGNSSAEGRVIVGNERFILDSFVELDCYPSCTDGQFIDKYKIVFKKQ